VKSPVKNYTCLWIARIENARPTFFASKVTDVTGPASTSRIPQIVGYETFRGMVLHRRAWDQSKMPSDDKGYVYQLVVGAKFATDMAYAAAKAGQRAAWDVGKSDAGPPAFAPATDLVYKNSYGRLSTRFTASLIVSIGQSETTRTHFPHGTSVGRHFHEKTWAFLDASFR